MNFHPDYRIFLKAGGDVGNSLLEPAIILPGVPHLDLFEIAATAWNQMGLPRDQLPFIEDNGDYYCVNSRGEVTYWSHNGSGNERWPSISAWRQQVCIDEVSERD